MAAAPAQLRVTFVGDKGVGKTALAMTCQGMVGWREPGAYMPAIQDGTATVGGRTVQLFDLPGDRADEGQNAVRRLGYTVGACYLLCYHSPATLQSLTWWRDDVAAALQAPQATSGGHGGPASRRLHALVVRTRANSVPAWPGERDAVAAVELGPAMLVDAMDGAGINALLRSAVTLLEQGG